ncbi:MAG: adenosylcobinamide-GDP ribazoletransferase [Emticicia sp.]|nr:adenosylcobinamide-GDP ribazoletransferase [Emticicia sp.]
MKNEIRIFFTALMFYTRIPCPPSTDHSPEYINKATRYFPFIGWIVGSISFVVYALFSLLFEVEIAVVFSLVAGILCTGAFHEDGFADVFDGFGGGWTKTKILEIMKDSRIGAYGGIAIGLLMVLKILVLSKLLLKIDSENYFIIGLVFIAYHALARLTAINIVFNSEYAREDETSKAKPIAKGHTPVEIIGAYAFGLIPLGILSFTHPLFLVVLLPLILLYGYSNRYFKKWLGGYTGDCLGAVEQAAEIIVLLSFLAIWKYI